MGMYRFQEWVMGKALKAWMDRLFPEWGAERAARAAERAARQERDAMLSALIANSYEKIQVVGRGTIQIDAAEVASTEQFKRAREQARQIVVASH